MSRRGLSRHLPKLIGAAVVVGVGVGMVLLIMHFMGAEPPQPDERKVQQITVVKPPPPKPEKKIEKPPEPKTQEEVDVPEPEAMPEEMPEVAEQPPLGEELGLDAEGVAGADGFGLAARKGGRGLLGGQAGDPFVWYASQLQRQLETALLEDDEMRRHDYSVVARIWVAGDGSIHRAELAGSTGSEQTDRLLLSRIENLPPLADMPPDDMPQPIRLRISSQI